MNKTQKFIGLLAILPLALVTLSPDFIGDADAANVGRQDVIGRPGYQPDYVCGDWLCSVSGSDSSPKSEQKLSKSCVCAEYDALSAQFAEKTQELRIANANGDSDKVAELQDELKDIRNQIAEWKNN